MEVVAGHLANSFQFGSGGKGRRGETYLGNGKGPGTAGPFKQHLENPDDWKCPCGYPVWARKDICPKCNEPKAEGKGLGIK
eukprot:10447687-Heterocapsa_arctica.AAC.1